MKLKFLLLLVIFSTLNAFSNNSLLEDNLEYSARVEGDYVYVNLSTSDRNSMLSMIRRGFSVYFDLKGKKKKKIAVTYIIPPKQPNQREQRPQGQQQGGRRNQGLPINQMLSLMPDKALFSYYNDKTEFLLDLNNLDITLGYSYDEPSSGSEKLSYTLKIPVSRIAPNGEKLNTLSIGIVSNTVPTNRSGVNNQNRNGAGQGGGQSRGGARQGRGGAGARQGGGQGGRPNRAQGGNQNQRPQLPAFSLWFDCDIK